MIERADSVDAHDGSWARLEVHTAQVREISSCVAVSYYDLLLGSNKIIYLLTRLLLSICSSQDYTPIHA